MIVDSNGTNLTEKINRNATVTGYNGCSELHMPSFTPNSSIFFEGHWGAEKGLVLSGFSNSSRDA